MRPITADGCSTVRRADERGHNVHWFRAPSTPATFQL
ncbi:hypothetical protein GZL_04600 [Streptomyces sp. 769]|nr:hypothetical protein GZL_04600 [Streptomyces sp. 769]